MKSIRFDVYSETIRNWYRTGVDAWSLGIEASAVVGLRMMKMLAGGNAAVAESRLMVVEKVRASAELHDTFLTGPSGTTPLKRTTEAVRHYRSKVADNRYRLMQTRID